MLLQAWGILWVVIGHAPHYILYDEPEYAQFLRDIARPVRMPSFIFISGLLFYMTRISLPEKWNYISIVKEKAIRIGIPFIAITIVAYIFKCLVGHDKDYHFGLNTFLTSFVTPSEGPAAMLWFSMTIFVFFLLYHLWYYATKKGMWECILLIILYYIHYAGIGVNYFCLGYCAKFGVWFYAGILVAKYKVYLQIEKKGGATFLLGLAVFVLGWIIDIRDVITIGGISLSCGLCVLLDKHYPNIFKSFRNYTYQIFLISCFAQIGVKTITRHYEFPYFPIYVCSIIIGLYTPVFLSIIAKKTNNKYLLLSLGLK